jgi:hypothetical protein
MSSWIFGLGRTSSWDSQLLGGYRGHPDTAVKQRLHRHRQLDRTAFLKLGACLRVISTANVWQVSQQSRLAGSYV